MPASKKLIAVELDDRFADGLAAWPEATAGRLRVVRGDAREIDEARLVKEAGGDLPAMIVANLPYNVGTPLLVKWLKAGEWRGPMVLMFQKEVALRICAAPDEEHYGRLAVLAQRHDEPAHRHDHPARRVPAAAEGRQRRRRADAACRRARRLEISTRWKA